jgi:hypothetical protein
MDLPELITGWSIDWDTVRFLSDICCEFELLLIGAKSDWLLFNELDDERDKLCSE